jgi:hypothetical protein
MMERRLRVVGDQPERTLVQVNVGLSGRAHLHDLDERGGLRTLCGLRADDDEPEIYDGFEPCVRCWRAARARGFPVDDTGFFDRPIARYYPRAE